MCIRDRRQGHEIPKTLNTASIKDALFEITAKRLGMTVVVDENEHVLGIFTDGDLRRLLEKSSSLEGVALTFAMTKNPRTISAQALAAEAVEMMERFRISQLVVTDEQGRLIGALNMHDLFAAKII